MPAPHRTERTARGIGTMSKDSLVHLDLEANAHHSHP